MSKLALVVYKDLKERVKITLLNILFYTVRSIQVEVKDLILICC